MQQPQRDTGKVDNAYAFGLIYLLLNAHRMCLAVFMRRNFGTHAHEPHSLVAMVGLLLLAGAYPVFRLYLAAWFIVLMGQRIQSYRLRLKGRDGHSAYSGYPWLAMRLPGVKTEKGAREAEPFLCVLMGAVLLTIYPPLGAFVLAGFVSFGGCMLIDRMIDRQRLRAMKDSEIEMRYYAEKWRERGN